MKTPRRSRRRRAAVSNPLAASIRNPRPSPAISRVILLLATLLSAQAMPAAAQPDSIRYATRITTGNRMGVSVTNYGFLGNNFVTRAPSMEFPVGTGYEHLAHGGLWIGARAVDDVGSFIGVSTACLDLSQGSPTPSATEYTPAGLDLGVRSTLPTSAHYSPDAVSEEDVIGTFSDRPAKRADGNPESHRPMSLLVRQESYSWSFGDFQDVVFIRYVISTLGPPLQNVWAGLYTELSSGPKNSYSSWPPNATGSPFGSWYSKKLLAWDAADRLLREHRCSGYPVPAGCQFAVTPFWAGMALLTPPAVGQHVTLAAWNWSPGNPQRDQDVERYAVMSAGTTQDLSTPDLMPITGDPVELLALGPFPFLAPGDSIVVDFALAGGAEIADIQRVVRAAQTLRDAGFDIDVVPALASLVHAAADPGHAELVWRVGEAGGELAIQRRTEGRDWVEVGRGAADGTGTLRFVDRTVEPGARYGYRLAWRNPSGAEVAAGETWIDVPRTAAFALTGPRETPSRGTHVEVSFSLPDLTTATLEVLDLAGRRVIARDVTPASAGTQVVRLEPAHPLAPGVYLVRLVQAARSARARLVVVQ